MISSMCIHTHLFIHPSIQFLLSRSNPRTFPVFLADHLFLLTSIFPFSFLHMLSFHHHFFWINVKLPIFYTDPVYVYVIMLIILIHPSPMGCISLPIYLICLSKLSISPPVYTIKSSNQHVAIRSRSPTC